MFLFLKYINPIWYFNLKPDVDQGYFPSLKQLHDAGYPINLDEGYKSEEASELDLSWNAFQSGFITKETEPGLDIWSPFAFPLVDEYRFVKKNFHPVWRFYVLFMRLLSLHNPISELKAFMHTKSVIRINHARAPYPHTTYESFEGNLIKTKPLISIVIPTLNRYEYLKDVFLDLEKQSYKNFEVIVVDQSEPFNEEFYKGWNFYLRYWFQEEKALWKARNDAIKSATGEYILLYDDDSRVEPHWIEHHLRTMDFFNADLSSGVSISKVGAKVPAHYSYFRWSDQLDTGNVLIKKSVFERIGLFDRQFEKQRMGDGEYGLRAYLAGFRNISNPHARRIHLKVKEGGLRQMGSWDGWRPKSLFAPRPIPSVLYYYRKYYGNQMARISLFQNIIPSLVPYRFKGRDSSYVIGILFAIIFSPLLFVQIWRSWKLSSSKIKSGSLIQYI